jgi:hypothetical protein
MVLITWFTTSKKSAHVEFGLNVQNFHWHVFPMPISVSDTHGPFTLRDTHEPIAPDTEIRERQLTSYVTLTNSETEVIKIAVT